MSLRALIAIAIGVSACAGPHAAVPCRSSADCTLAAGGACEPVSAETSWCAYPCQCAGGLCYSDLAGDGLAGSCVNGGDTPDAPTGAIDGGADASIAPDAKLGTWSAPSPVIPSTTADESAPAVSPDRRTLYFTEQQSGSLLLDVLQITRPSTADPWGTTESQVSAGIDTNNASESDAAISENGLELYFVRGNDIYVAKRSSTVSAWGAPSPIGYSGDKVMLSDNGLTLYFYDSGASCPTGNCRAKLTRGSTSGSWGSRTDVVFPDGGAAQYQDVFVSDDGLRVLLSGPGSGASAPVARAFRSSETSAWGAVAPISELSLYTNIRYARWSWDESEMYLVSNGDLYVSTYQP